MLQSFCHDTVLSPRGNVNGIQFPLPASPDLEGLHDLARVGIVWTDEIAGQETFLALAARPQALIQFDDDSHRPGVDNDCFS